MQAPNANKRGNNKLPNTQQTKKRRVMFAELESDNLENTLKEASFNRLVTMIQELADSNKKYRDLHKATANFVHEILRTGVLDEDADLGSTSVRIKELEAKIIRLEKEKEFFRQLWSPNSQQFASLLDLTETLQNPLITEPK
jgi:hypothetical protein